MLALPIVRGRTIGAPWVDSGMDVRSDGLSNHRKFFCPRCGGRMRIIAFIQDPAVIEKILRHLGQWDPPRAPPPPAAEQGRRIEYDEYCQDSDFAEGA